MSIESVMPSSHLILCRPLLLLPQIPPSISVFEKQKSKQLGIILYLSTTKQGKAGLSIPEDVVWGSHSGTQPGGILHSICVPCDLASPLKRVCMLSHFSCVRLIVTPWTIAHQVPLSMGILQARILEWVAIPFSRASSPPREGTRISYVSWSPVLASGSFTTSKIWEAPTGCKSELKPHVSLYGDTCEDFVPVFLWVTDCLCVHHSENSEV